MEKQGGLGSFFPVDMGKATLCKVSWLLLSLKYASCAVSGAYFPWNSTVKEAPCEVSLM